MAVHGGAMKAEFYEQQNEVKILLFAWPIKYSTTKQITNETQKPKERGSFYAIICLKKIRNKQHVQGEQTHPLLPTSQLIQCLINSKT